MLGLGLLATTFWKFSSIISLSEEIDEVDGVGGWGYGGSICLYSYTSTRAKTTQIRDVEGGRFPKSSGLVTPLCTE